MSPAIEYELGGQRRQHPLESDEVSIGRSPDNDLVIQDVSISRHHALLTRHEGSWRIRDLGSKNGTHVKDVGESDAPLRNGDEILLGKFPLLFVDEVESSVELTPSGSQVDDASGTVFRSAVDFSALAGQGPAEAAAPERLDVDRLQKLLAIVTEVSGALLAPQPLEVTLNRLMDLVFEHLPVERGCIMLWDDEREDLAARLVRAREKKEGEQAEIAISRTIAEKVYKEKVAVLTTDAQEDPRFAGGASIMALGIRSAMAAPLWRGDRVDGIIYVDTPLHVRAFDDFDLDLLSALGNHVALALETHRLQEGILAERLSRERLERYHSPAVVERITKVGAGDALSAEEREVTVLFADVVGFTARCERLSPTDVADLLNRNFSVMADMIFRHEGTLDKFIGDCLMAVFGAPLDMEDHPARAVMSALDMREALDQLNEEIPEEERVQFRVGIHSGRVVAGDMGSLRRRDYTVLGATVNLASRLESVVAQPGQIVVSDVVHEAMGDRFLDRFVWEGQPKGISRVVRCYEVLGCRDGAADAATAAGPRA